MYQYINFQYFQGTLETIRAHIFFFSFHQLHTSKSHKIFHQLAGCSNLLLL